MNLLTAEEAAGMLRLNVKRVQGLAREGKLPAVRVGRKWLFHREELQRMLGKAEAPEPFAAISARNHLRGRIVGLRSDGLMTEVRLEIGDQELVAVITRSSAERLGLAVGDVAFAIVKSTEVIIGKGPA